VQQQVICKHQGHHRFHHRYGPRQHAGVVPSLGLQGGGGACGIDGLLGKDLNFFPRNKVEEYSPIYFFISNK
jgi:hypothetical protein